MTSETKTRKTTKKFDLFRERRPLTRRLDIFPFLSVVYPIWFSILTIYIFTPGLPDLTPLVVLGCGLTVLSHLLLHLSTHWSVAWRTCLCFVQVDNLEDATHVRVTPFKSGRKIALCPIIRHTSDTSDSEMIITIDFLKKRYRYQSSTQTFEPIQFPVNLPIIQYVSSQCSDGLSSSCVQSQFQRYGPNNFDINLPTFIELYKQHAVAPFFVFQVFCVTLWLLDEYWAHSLMTLVLLIFLEAQLVFKRLKEIRELKEMRLKPIPIPVYRDKKWVNVLSDQLVPGDIFSVYRINLSQYGVGFVCPCDALLLQGSVVMNESVLTGESIPQSKVPLLIDDTNKNQLLDPKGTQRQHILFAGTTVVAHHPQAEESIPGGLEHRYKKVPNQGCVCYVLRTGFETTQGKIVRTILYSAERVTGESREALLFLFILLLCSLIASGHVLYHNWNQTGSGKRSRYKLLLNCIMILTSVLPPEFPITMSMAVTLSLVELIKKKIFCTEPFRLPFAGRATVCAFDKTGTLTSDKMEVRGVLGLQNTEEIESRILLESPLDKSDSALLDDLSNPSTDAPSTTKKEKTIMKTKQIQILPFSTIAVMAGCHSLALVDSVVVGDPTEKAIVESIGWNVKSMDVVISSGPGESDILTIVRRFPFASELQRMTVIAQHSGLAKSAELNGIANKEIHQQMDSVFTERTGSYVLSKGSPEMLRTFLKSPPSYYDQLCNRFSLSGYRVLCLAVKRLGKPSSEYLRMDRSCLESELEFAGLLVIGCPVKPYTIKSITSLKQSNHKVIMITGDHPLTACQVAIDIGLVTRNPSISISSQCLILENVIDTESSCLWKSRDGNEIIKIQPCNKMALEKLAQSRSLCLTGQVLETHQKSSLLFSYIISCVSVFARMTPQQKELIIASLNAAGEIVIMCGDGTNDVGALKAAHIGVSLLSAPLPPETAAKLPGNSNMRLSVPQARRGKETLKEKLQRMAAEDEATTQQPQLGTASIASPFTHKGESIRCVPTIIRLGRATLSTVMTSYKTMAINSLITAFALSVLTLDGVKLGDLQMTIENLFISFLVFAASRAQPAKHLDPRRPVESIFYPPVLISIFGQTIIHLGTLYFGWVRACSYRSVDYQPDIDGEFSSSLVNTIVFYILAGTHGSSFLANYEGEPFLISMRNNKLLWRGLLVFFFGLMILVLELCPPFNEYFSLVILPDQKIKLFLIQLLTLDILGSWMIGRFCCSLGIQSMNRFRRGNETKKLKDE